MQSNEWRIINTNVEWSLISITFQCDFKACLTFPMASSATTADPPTAAVSGLPFPSPAVAPTLATSTAATTTPVLTWRNDVNRMINNSIINWWKGKPSGSIACTRKQQPRFYWSCSSVVMNDATPLTPPSAWAELHFQMSTTYMYTPWSLRTRKIWLHNDVLRVDFYSRSWCNILITIWHIGAGKRVHQLSSSLWLHIWLKYKNTSIIIVLNYWERIKIPRHHKHRNECCLVISHYSINVVHKNIIFKCLFFNYDYNIIIKLKR